MSLTDSEKTLAVALMRADRTLIAERAAARRALRAAAIQARWREENDFVHSAKAIRDAIRAALEAAGVPTRTPR